LNQANLQQNNNKFYILQVLQSEADSTRFIFFTRWGRVGVVGQQAEQFCPNSGAAIREFHSKKRSKCNGGYK
jgi:poly [ADP-ribose] polymerase